MNRSRFLQLCLGSTAAVYFTKCSTNNNSYKVLIADDNATAGHLLRTPPTSYTIFKTVITDITIIGGGVTALSAARWLSKNTTKEITILELAPTLGGNAAAGKNEVSAFPWAAHYLPIPNNKDDLLINFLQESKIITETQKGLPVYNEEYLCADPKERLYIGGRWQEGIIPNTGILKQEREDLKRFLQYIESIKDKKGTDGKFVFDLPLSKCSTQNDFIALDKISFSDWLKQNNYNSKAVLWYTNYACSDDYGANISQVSAWAGLHYFCGRRGVGFNAKQHEVLTWPEGNYFLINKLAAQAKAIIKTNEVVFSAKEVAGKWELVHYNTIDKTYTKTICHTLISAAPMRVSNILFPNSIPRQLLALATHFPWLNANITLKEKLKNAVGIEQSWDNVFYGKKSLGYVVATHQNLINQKQQVITFYYPLNTAPAKAGRNTIRNASSETMKQMIINELKEAHPNIESLIVSIEIKVLGHGMIAPVPNYIFNELRKQPLVNEKYNLVFAHTDYSGISVFEEAFHAGIKAAEKLLNNA